MHISSVGNDESSELCNGLLVVLAPTRQEPIQLDAVQVFVCCIAFVLRAEIERDGKHFQCVYILVAFRFLSVLHICKFDDYLHYLFCT